VSRETLNTFDGKESSQSGLGDLKDRVSDLTSKVKDKAGEAVDTVSEKVGQARETAAGRLGRAASTTHNLADGMQSTASYLREHDFSQIGKDVMNICRRYPTQSLIAAIAVGFLLGRVRRH
jgi:ElaB/YqjD/DUF883 family membrane-anchored ribosome-binding protein